LQALTAGWRAILVAARRALTLGAPAGVGLSAILLRPQRRGLLPRLICGGAPGARVAPRRIRPTIY
jgi:hypothetical protein